MTQLKLFVQEKVRRAKLYYLRDRTGKSARIAEKIRKKIGIDIDVKPETVTEENLAPVSTEASDNKEDVTKAEAKKEETPKEEPKKEETAKVKTKPKTEEKLETSPEKK